MLFPLRRQAVDISHLLLQFYAHIIEISAISSFYSHVLLFQKYSQL